MKFTVDQGEISVQFVDSFKNKLSFDLAGSSKDMLKQRGIWDSVFLKNLLWGGSIGATFKPQKITFLK